MKIGVFGDSFAVREGFKQDESWLHVLEDRGYDVETYGVSGTSCWYSYKQFLDNYKKYTHIVFVYSSTNRFHNLPDELIQFSNFHRLTDPRISTSRFFLDLSDENREILAQIMDVHKYIEDEVFDLFVCQNIFNTVNYIVNEDPERKLVNILPFNTDGNKMNIDLFSRKGACITDLVEVSVKEMPNLLKKTWTDPRSCHLSKENNITLADIILESFSNDSIDIINTYKSGRFVYSDEIAERYYDMLKTQLEKNTGLI